MAAENDIVHIEPLLYLRNAIIERTIDDYKALVAGACKAKPDRNIKEIEAFLMSQWCGVLLNISDATGPEILKELREWHGEYTEAKRRPYPKRKILRHK